MREYKLLKNLHSYARPAGDADGTAIASAVLTPEELVEAFPVSNPAGGDYVYEDGVMYHPEYPEIEVGDTIDPLVWSPI